MTDASDLKIINNALARIGEGAIPSRTFTSDLVDQVNAVFDDVMDAAHAAYPWKWARQTVPLAALAPPDPPDTTLPGPFNGWAYAYAFPILALSNPIALYRAWPSDPIRAFTTEGTTIYANDPTVFGTFITRQDSQTFPPMFRMGVTVWLAAELAIPVTHDKDLAAHLRETAIGTDAEAMRGGFIGRAIAQDVAQGGGTTASVMQSDPLTTARYRGAWHGSY